MAQIWFSQTNLGPGATSSAFTLPGGDGQARSFLVTYNRDPGLVGANGLDINLGCAVTIFQGTVAILTDNTVGASSVAVIQPNTLPGAATLTIQNAGPGTIQCVTVSDFDDRQ